MSSVIKYQSKRRGKLATDAESVERRAWYENHQKHILMDKDTGDDVKSDSNDKAGRIQAVNRKVNGNSDSISMNININHMSIDGEYQHRKSKIKTNRWIRQLNMPIEYTATVICFHGIGQSHSYFRHLSKLFTDQHWRLLAVCLPGRMVSKHE